MDQIDQLLTQVRDCEDEAKLFEYSRSTMPGVALEVAKSHNATPRLLENLTRHPSITVRHEVAKNKNCSVETLKRISDDDDMLVRDYARRTLLFKELSAKKES